MNEKIAYKSVAEVTVYEVSGVAPGPGPENVGPLIPGLLSALDEALENNDRPMLEPGIFWYSDSPDGLTVHVSYTADLPAQPGAGYEVTILPALDTAATLIHRGDVSGIGDSWQALYEGLSADGYRPIGDAREVYLEAAGHDPQDDWVIEIQVPVVKAAQ